MGGGGGLGDCKEGVGQGRALYPTSAQSTSPHPVEFSEICPSGKGYIPVEGAWMFGQTTYTGKPRTSALPAQPGWDSNIL